MAYTRKEELTDSDSDYADDVDIFPVNEGKIVSNTRSFVELTKSQLTSEVEQLFYLLDHDPAQLNLDTLCDSVIEAFIDEAIETENLVCITQNSVPLSFIMKKLPKKRELLFSTLIQENYLENFGCLETLVKYFPTKHTEI